MSLNKSIELEFSGKYDREHAQQYLHKHQDGLARRLSHWRDVQLARRALKRAGEPNLVLDLPSGAGRFWSLLAEQPNRVILAADNSRDMLAIAMAGQPEDVVARVKTFQTSAFAIDLTENAVDSIFCMRLLHHIADPEHRLAMLREFHRVTRDTLIVSLWVDGNYKAWKRRRLEARRAAEGRASENQNRFVIAKDVVEAEFKRGGESGVQRVRDKNHKLLYIKRQSGHLYRSWRHPLGRPTVLREQQAMQALSKLGIHVPRLVYCEAQKDAGQWRALLVSEALEGFVSLDDWYASGEPQRDGGELNRNMLQQLSIMLSRLHRAAWQHGCLYPKHIFIKRHQTADGDWAEVALLDLEKSRRRLLSVTASRRDLQQLYRHKGAMPEGDWQLLINSYNCFIRAVEPYSHDEI